MNDRAMISTPEGVDLEFPLAGFVSRAMATVVDTLILLAFWLFLVLAVVGGWGAVERDSVVMALLILAIFVTNWGYSVAFELSMRGQTPGKRMAGLRVLRQDGLPIGFKESALRNLCRILDAQPAPFYLVGGVSVLVDPMGRRLGDLLAGTVVVSESLGTVRGTRAGATWAARAERGQAHQAVRLGRGTLSARQLALIEQFLERCHTLTLERRQTLARSLAEPIKGLMDDAMLDSLQRDPLQTLEQIRLLAQTQEGTVSAPKPEPAVRGSLW